MPKLSPWWLLLSFAVGALAVYGIELATYAHEAKNVGPVLSGVGHILSGLGTLGIAIGGARAYRSWERTHREDRGTKTADEALLWLVDTDQRLRAAVETFKDGYALAPYMRMLEDPAVWEAYNTVTARVGAFIPEAQDVLVAATVRIRITIRLLSDHGGKKELSKEEKETLLEWAPTRAAITKAEGVLRKLALADPGKATEPEKAAP